MKNVDARTERGWCRLFVKIEMSSRLLDKKFTTIPNVPYSYIT
jgi:hypothetical protein